MSTLTAHQAIEHFKSFLGKPRTELPWINGTTNGFPNRVHGFYDCALGYSYFSGLRPVIVSCHVVRDYCLHNKTWHTTFEGVLPGDAVIFDWTSGLGLGKNTGTDHIGMVISVDPHKKTVTYVSADTGKVIPGIVTVNTVGATYISGFGRPVKFAEPEHLIPAVNTDQQAAHAHPGVVIPETTAAPVASTFGAPTAI